MAEKIGMAAGQIWQLLRQSGPANIAQIQKGTGLDATLANQGLGWLAREAKLKVDRSKKAVMYELVG